MFKKESKESGITTFGRLFVVIIFFLSACPGAAVQAQMIHAVIAADQDERANLGRNVKSDSDNMVWLLQSNIPSHQLNLRIVSVDRVNPTSILQELQSLDVAPNDTVLFYFSGHGAFDPQKNEQYLQMEGRGNLYRSMVVKTIQSKSPRLSVILTDCCNIKAVPGKYVFQTHAQDKVAKIPDVISPLFENLFVFCKGHVDVTSSKLGEYSFVDTSGQYRGSCFTYPLVELMDANKVNDEINWSKLVERLCPRVNEAFKESFPKGYQGQTSQTIHVYAIPGQASAGTPVNVVSSSPQQQTTPTGPRLGLRAINHQNLGVRITAIIPNSPASKIGFQIGDIITEINGKKITNETQYSDAIDESPRNMTMKIQRQGSNTPVSYPVELGW